MEANGGLTAFLRMARPEESNPLYVKQNDDPHGSTVNGKHVGNETNKLDWISQGQQKPKKPVTQIDIIINTMYFLLKIIACILLWIIVAVCLVIPFAIPVLVYYVSELIEQFIYKMLHDAEPLTGSDLMWTQDDPKNQMIINGLLIAEGQMDASKLQKILERKFVNATDKSGKRLYSRTTKYVHSGLLSYYWIEEENFRLEDHVWSSADEVKSKEELRQLLSDLCSRPLKPGCSPWQYVVIPWDCGNGLNKVAIFFRGHHSMADGISLARFAACELPDIQPKQIELRKFSERDRILLTLKGIFWTPIFLAKMLTTGADQSTLRPRELSGKKRITWSTPIDLNLVKRIKNATKTTVNDVLVSCLTGALVKYFQTKGLKQPNNMAVSLPIDVRKNMNDDAVDFANKFAVLQFKLPTGKEEPLSMLYETKRRMDELKMSGEPFALSLQVALLNKMLPEVVTWPFFKFISEKSVAVLSNVPGPQSPITIAGCEMECMTFWPPQRDNIGMSFSICSYANKVFVGVSADEAILQDPHEICGKFEGQVAKLRDCCDLLKID